MLNPVGSLKKQITKKQISNKHQRIKVLKDQLKRMKQGTRNIRAPVEVVFYFNTFFQIPNIAAVKTVNPRWTIKVFLLLSVIE